jgi:hypothetical protein
VACGRPEHNSHESKRSRGREMGSGRRCRWSIAWTSGADANTLSVLREQATKLHRGGEYGQAMAIYQRMFESPGAFDAEVRSYVLSEIADINIERGMYGDAVTKSREAIRRLLSRDTRETERSYCQKLKRFNVAMHLHLLSHKS